MRLKGRQPTLRCRDGRTPPLQVHPPSTSGRDKGPDADLPVMETTPQRIHRRRQMKTARFFIQPLGQGATFSRRNRWHRLVQGHYFSRESR